VTPAPVKNPKPTAICVYPTLFNIRVYYKRPNKETLEFAYVVAKRGKRVTAETVLENEQKAFPGVHAYISQDWKEIYNAPSEW